MQASDIKFVSDTRPVGTAQGPDERSNAQSRKASITVIGIGLLAFFGAVTTSHQAVSPGTALSRQTALHLTSVPALSGAPRYEATALMRLPENFVARRPQAIGTELADHLGGASRAPLLSNVAFDLSAVRSAETLVPRVFLESLPAGFSRSMPVATRKSEFLRIVLPIVLSVNEEIRSDRTNAQTLLSKMAGGSALTTEEFEWLNALASRYKIDPVRDIADFGPLLNRVDEISVSVALAQAIEESGWGRSRFARDGNALFGQRTWVTGGGIVPTGRGATQTFEVKIFPTLHDSVKRYAHNLNTHGAYRTLRAMRGDARRANIPLNGNELAAGLISYSERGMAYVSNIRSLIRTNRLDDLERATLSDAEKEA